ncbi:MAG: ABC transporter permease [Thermodesulfobacteriota bacterium]
MTLKSIAIKNLLRRKGKTGFILAGLVIGVATVVAMISYVNATTAEINEKLEKYGANILVIPRTDNLTLSYGGLTLAGVAFEMQEIQQSELERIGSIKNAANIAAVGPVVLGGVDIAGRKALLAGIDFSSATILKPWWRVKGGIPESGQVMVGSEVARVFNVSPGGALEISNLSIPVAGVLQPTGSQDDQLIFTGLATAQTMLNKPGMVSMVEVAALCNACPITEMVRQISEVLPAAKVMAIQQVVKGRMETLTQLKTFSFGVSAVVILIGGMVVLVTLMGSVRERQQEIGIFRAIGFRKKHVMHIVFIETGVVSIVAGVLGYGIGVLAATGGLKIIGSGHFRWPALDPVLAVNAVLGAVAIGLIASIYPAIMASRLDPNDALKAI